MFYVFDGCKTDVIIVIKLYIIYLWNYCILNNYYFFKFTQYFPIIILLNMYLCLVSGHYYLILH